MTKNDRKIIVTIKKSEKSINLKNIVDTIVTELKKGGENKNDR